MYFKLFITAVSSSCASSGVSPCFGHASDGLRASGDRLRVYRLLPVVGIDVEHIAELALDFGALRGRRLGMIRNPVLGAERLQDSLERIGPVFEGDPAKPRA